MPPTILTVELALPEAVIETSPSVEEIAVDTLPSIMMSVAFKVTLSFAAMRTSEDSEDSATVPSALTLSTASSPRASILMSELTAVKTTPLVPTALTFAPASCSAR